MASVAVIGGSVNITSKDETELLNALFVGGPVSVSYHVASGFSDYTGGVY